MADKLADKGKHSGGGIGGRYSQENYCAMLAGERERTYVKGIDTRPALAVAGLWSSCAADATLYGSKWDNSKKGVIGARIEC